jgi:hypothetical protein
VTHSPDLNDAFAVAPKVGPLAGLASGSRGERPAFETWPDYSTLPPPIRLVVQEVWSGTRKQALVMHAGRLHLVQHVASGVADPSGRRFGFVVRTVTCVPADSPRQQRVGGKGRTARALAGLALVAGTFAAGWFAPALFPEPPQAQAADRPAAAAIAPMAAEPARRIPATTEVPKADVERRRVAVQQFNDHTAQLEAINKRDSDWLRRRQEDAPTSGPAPSKPEKS